MRKITHSDPLAKRRTRNGQTFDTRNPRPLRQVLRMPRRMWSMALLSPLPLGRLGSPWRRLRHDGDRAAAILPAVQSTLATEGDSSRAERIGPGLLRLLADDLFVLT